MAHQSLYRRYRSQRFADLVGQEPVVRALRNAVAQNSHGHAYLFSGPRGTGKTSMARILAKALNCSDLTDGEPCGTCESCKAIELGTSYDVFELDAASNNGVDAMRDLIARTSVSSPGRTKVYILDEVHMLSPGASNALLKTLEEPPEHVVFVLATTDPHKVPPTIRSRAQHFEFTLLTAAELTEHVRWIVADAELAVDEAAIAHVVRQGRGSARDTLSALDMVVAAGGVTERSEPLDEILEALVNRDVAHVLQAVAGAVAQGSEPRVLTEALLVSLRDAFLAVVGADLSHLSGDDRTRLGELGGRLSAPRITRSLEALGTALVDMRQAAEPRIPLEVALIRLCDPASDNSPAALLERIERLEHAIVRGAANGDPGESPPTRPSRATAGDATTVETNAVAEPGAASAPTAPPERPAPRPAPPRPPTRASRTAAEPPTEGSAPPVAPSPSVAPPVDPAPPAAAPPSGPALSADELQVALTQSVLTTLRPVARAIYSEGHFAAGVDPATPAFVVNAAIHDRAESSRAAVEAGLSQHLGRPVRFVLVDAGVPPPAAPVVAEDPDIHDVTDVADLDDAVDVSVSGVDKLSEAFPGAVLIEQEPS